MDFDKQIRTEVRMAQNKHWRAYLRREKALEHKPPASAGESVFDYTKFGQRSLLEDWIDVPDAFNRPDPDKSLGLCEIEQLEDDSNDILGIR